MRLSILLLVLGLFGCGLIAGCIPSNVVPEQQTQPDIVENTDIIENQVPTAIGFTRVFSKETVAPGETFTLKLYVNVKEGQTYYVAEETVPKEFSVISGEVDSNNHLKIITIQDAKSTVYEYTLKAPVTKGTYAFSGEYSVEGMESIAAIMGPTTIKVG